MENSTITSFLLLGFPGPFSFRILLFLLILLTYCMTIYGNLMVITLVSYSKNLHSPMYFFLTQLTISDILTTSDIAPNMLHIILYNGSSMSVLGCITQLFFFFFSECADCLLLTWMSYDRYLAICKPLYYHSTMSPVLCLKSIIISWLIGFLAALITTTCVSQLPFCRSNMIDHFFCDLDPILELSCSDAFHVKLLSTLLAYPLLITPFSVIVISYTYILCTILKIQSINQREKAFSTCGSHLAVVSLFYGTLFSIYLTPIKGKSSLFRKFPSLMYCVVTPLINPVIYSLRNNDIKIALRKFIVR